MQRATESGKNVNEMLDCRSCRCWSTLCLASYHTERQMYVEKLERPLQFVPKGFGAYLCAI